MTKKDTLASIAKKNGFSPTDVTSGRSVAVVPESPASNATAERGPGTKRRNTSSGVKERKTKKAKTPKTGSVHEKICRAIAELNAYGIKVPLRYRVAIYAGYTKSPAGYTKALSALRSAGIIECPTKDTLKFTEFAKATLFSKGYGDLGIGRLDNFQSPKTNAGMQKQLLNRIGSMAGSPNKMKQIFEYLRDGKVRTRKEVAIEVGYRSEKDSGFKKILSHMSSIGLVNYPSKSTVQLDDIAFPRGREAAHDMDDDDAEDEVVEDEEESSDDDSSVTVLDNVESRSVAVDLTESTDTSSDAGVPTDVTVMSTASSIDSLWSFATVEKKTPPSPSEATEVTADVFEIDDENLTSLIPDPVEQRICNGLMELRATNIVEPSRRLLALFAGFKNKSSETFTAGISSLHEQGIIELGNGTVILTQLGINKLKTIDPPSTNAEMQEHLRTLIKAVHHFPAIKVDALFELLKGGGAYSREDVASVIGYSNVTRGDFTKMISTLKKIGILHYPRQNHVQLTDIAFPYKRNKTMKSKSVRFSDDFVIEESTFV